MRKKFLLYVFFIFLTAFYVVSDITWRGLISLKNNYKEQKRRKAMRSWSFLKFGCYQWNSRINRWNEWSKHWPVYPKSYTVENRRNTSQKYIWPKQADSRWQALIVTDYSDKLPEEIVEKILIESIESSDYMCKTYNNVINTSIRF